MRKLAIKMVYVSLIAVSFLIYSAVSGNNGFLVYETNTYAWNIDLGTVAVGIPKSFNVTVDCREETGEFYVTYFLEISGPESLSNDYIRLRWQDTDGADFVIGKDGDAKFLGTGTIRWNSSQPATFPAQHKNNIALTLTFLTTAAIGDYKAKIWVTFTEKPISAKLTITPRVLNVKSKGEWVTAYISLPDPFMERDVDVDSVKLWYRGSFVKAAWGKVIGNMLLVKFSREQVIKMLGLASGRVTLAVAGLVDALEFSGTDTIFVLRF